MHIVINAFSARRGGGKTYLKNLLLHCPDDDFKVTLLISPSSDITVVNPNIHIYRVKFPVENPILRMFWEKIILPRFLRRSKADIFFCPGGVVPIASTNQWKTVTMFRNMIPFDKGQRKKYPLGYMRFRNFILSKVLLRSMENADLVIFISKYAKSVIQHISKKGIKKSVTIPHGVGNEFFCSSSRRTKPPALFPEKPYIFYPSIIDVYKSQLEVVKAVAILAGRGIDIPVVLMVGEVYGKYGVKVRTLINSMGLQDKVVLTGPAPHVDMPYLYHHAEFVIFASKSENCPNILLEALATGSVILCSDRMPMPEFGGDNVMYFDPGSPEQLADTIEKLVSDKIHTKLMNKRAVNKTELYQWQETAQKTWQSLLSL